MSMPPTHLLFAPVPTITMAENIVLIDLEGPISDWGVYTFSLNIPSPGTKRVILHIKHPDLHKYGHPWVREPYAQPIPFENITLEYGQDSDFAQDLQIKLESLEACIVPIVENSASHSIKSEDQVNAFTLCIICSSYHILKIEVPAFCCINYEDPVQGNIKLEPNIGIKSDATDHSTSLLPGCLPLYISQFPCCILTRCTSNPAPKEDRPSKSWKYYVQSFNPSILSFKIT
ncbi:hypothetical protein V8B97DRAFT_1876307 [Scleroderma yunnanense]